MSYGQSATIKVVRLKTINLSELSSSGVRVLDQKGKARRGGRFYKSSTKPSSHLPNASPITIQAGDKITSKFVIPDIL